MSRATTFVILPFLSLTFSACGGGGDNLQPSTAASAPSSGGTTASASTTALGCASEGSLSARSDVLFCEPWQSTDWWTQGYLKIASTSTPVAAASADVAKTQIVSSGCVAGSCLKVTMEKFNAGGALALHYPIPGKQEQVYIRYYMKLGPNFSPDTYTTSGTQTSNGGKFPGPADVRVWPEAQCGNGGAFSDGINCWSMRLKYRDCIGGSQNAHICANPSATTRIGGYFYSVVEQSFNNFGPWDNQSWGSQGGSCSSNNGLNCGIGSGGQLQNDRWYLIEMFVRMNTPGVANGVVRAWVDGALSYEKTNMTWRLVGHDNLHVRTMWLNIHAGGEGVGPPETTAVFLDQMVIATGAQIGAWAAP